VGEGARVVNEALLVTPKMVALRRVSPVALHPGEAPLPNRQQPLNRGGYHNAFDPAGFISLDKPPVSFWLQTASAKLPGFGTFSVLLPQVLAGLAAMGSLTARRRAGLGRT
jgi:hypothetical protein